MLAPKRFSYVCIVLLFGLLACASDSGFSGPPSTVTSVVVTGAPSIMLVGESVHLAATVTQSSVGVASVSWRTSNAAVATVDASGTVTSVATGSATITASTGGRDGTTLLDVRDGGTVLPQGAALSANGGRLSLVLPAGAVAQPTLVVIRPAVNVPPDSRVVASTQYEIGPDGLTLAGSAILSVRYDAARLPASASEATLGLYGLSGGTWRVAPSNSINIVTKTVSGTLTRGGIYAVRSSPVSRIVLSGANTFATLYASQSAQLVAVLLDGAGKALGGYAVSWSTSDSIVATVDATGRVTATKPGTVTITASSENNSAGILFTTLARPVADWSRAVEWTTLQGNTAHSGYMDVTVDPGTFSERWITTPQINTRSRPVVGGNGKVFVATNGGTAGERLIAFDAASGAELWNRVFNALGGINPPAYDNGMLYVTTTGYNDTYMYGIDPADGSTKFKTQFASQGEPYDAPVVVGQKVFTAGGYFGGFYGFDRATGVQRDFMSLPQYSEAWSPAVYNGVVYAFSASAAQGRGLRTYDAATGAALYQVGDTLLPIGGTPVVGGAHDVLTTFLNRLVSVDVQSRKVAWTQAGAFDGIPSVAGGVIYVRNAKHVEARRESDGSLLWAWAPPDDQTPQSTIVVTNNILFVSASNFFAGSSGTYAVDLTTHHEVWTYPLGGELSLSAQGTLYISTYAGTVAAIGVR